jgi:hypothetical protein
MRSIMICQTLRIQRRRKVLRGASKSITRMESHELEKKMKNERKYGPL